MFTFTEAELVFGGAALLLTGFVLGMIYVVWHNASIYEKTGKCLCGDPD